MPHTSESFNHPAHQARYRTAWRWHLYAGIYVIPFMLMLSITGLIMLLYQPVIAPLQYGHLLNIKPQNSAYTPWTEQQQAVKQAYPDALLTQLRIPQSNTETSRFTLKTSTGENLEVFVNPYTSEVLGSNSKDQSLYALADEIHGTFLLGETGDALIELAAGYSLILVLSGLFMWWPRRKGGILRLFIPRLQYRGRNLWKELHVSSGAWLSLALVFLILTGLSWTGIWGAKIVQPWNTFPTGVFGGVPTSGKTHASLNPGVIEEIPWNLEQTPLPQSGSAAGTAAISQSITLDAVIAYARQQGMTSFRVNLPRDDSGVYSIVAATMSKDKISPLDDRTIHLDQYSGKQLMDIRFEDYSLMAKAMAVGVPLHMGLWGNANLVLNAIICLLTIFLCISGIAMWWQRRPASSGFKISAPQGIPATRWKLALIFWLAVGISIPLVGASMLLIILAEALISTGRKLRTASESQ